MIKTYILTALSFFAFSIAHAEKDISNFTNNRDLKLEPDGVKLLNQTGYKVYSENDQKIYATKDYKMIVEKTDEITKVIEAKIDSENNDKADYLQMVTLDNRNQVTSYTNCKGSLTQGHTIVQDMANAMNFTAEGCATATSEVCDRLAYYVRNPDSAKNAVRACQELNTAMGGLQITMGKSEYKKTSSDNIHSLTDAYARTSHPQLFDGQNSKNTAKASKVSLGYTEKDTNNFIALTEACSKLNQITPEEERTYLTLTGSKEINDRNKKKHRKKSERIEPVIK